PFDLAEKRLAVLGVPNRARRDRQCALRTQRLELATVVGETVADARDRERQQSAARIDVLAEARDRASAHEWVDTPVGGLPGQEPSRVRPEIDRCDAHPLRP